jgi:hypothetical protein
MTRRTTQKSSRDLLSRSTLGAGNESSRLDRQLFKMLSRLATLLLRHGYGFSRTSQLAKSAFVNAAQELDGRDGSRSSIARMATVTGLTRTEVSKLVRSRRSLLSDVDTSFNRATQVADGWQSDSKFLDRFSRPKSLPFSSSRASFSQLVQAYSGDIPPRAMLTEMLRLGMVRRARNNSVYLLRATPSVAKSTVTALRAITEWVDLLAEYHGRNLTTSTSQVRVFFESVPQALAAIRELKERQNSFREAIEQLGVKDASKRAHELKVSIAMATEQPSQSSHRKSSNRKG